MNLLRRLRGTLSLSSRAWLAAAVIILAAARPAGAQVGSSTDIIAGVVLGPDSLPVEGARIEIQSAETRVTKRATTRADGRFSVLFRDGGGQYQLQASFIGMSPARLTVQRRGDEDRIVVTIRMSRNPTQLATVEVKGKSNTPQLPAPPAAGSIERNLPPQLLDRLPINAGDLAEVASLAPGVIAVAGTDSSGASFSVAGQSPTQNNKTVDGASFLFGGLPQDAVRSTKVVTNAYDVSRGQFTGGQIATTTKSGTNIFSGTANYTRRDPSLAYAAGPDAGFGQRFAQQTTSAGVGGAVIEDRLFYFASGELDVRNESTASLLSATDGTLAGLGTTRDSVSAFTAALQRLGVATSRPGSRRSQSGVGMLRVDYDLADAHSLMFRADVRHAAQDALRIAPTAVSSTGGESSTNGLGALGVLTSTFGNFLNEGRLSWSTEHTDGEPNVYVPTGVVSVASINDVGVQGISTYLFGGSQGFPRHTRSVLAEAGDELSWLSAGGGHRFKLGVLFNHEDARYGAPSNRYGTFLFNSLGDLSAGRPALFTRTLGYLDNDVGSNNVTAYLGDAWRHSASLQVAYGVRLESSSLTGMATRNAAVERTFSRLTDLAPSNTHLSPRLGFSYLLGNTIGIPQGFIRGGIGEFRGKLPLQVAAYARNATGDAGVQAQVVCVGDAAPIPQWNAYAENPANIPEQCVGPSAGSVSPTVPTVITLDQNFQPPRVWRASLGGARFFSRVNVSLESTLLLGLANPVARDMNLAPVAFLSSVEHRPVFVASEAIIGASGAAPLAASRVHPDFGPALALGSELQSNTVQITGSLSGNLWRRIYGQTSYTFTRSRDQSSGYSLGGYLPGTAGDPNRAEWGTSDLERRHALLGILNVPLRAGLELGIVARTTSGQHFTPMVNGDVNGDGSRNDRAFVADPAAVTDTALSNGMRRVLDATDSRSRQCLQSSFGAIAGRNICVAAWSTSLDAQLTFKPGLEKLQQRLSVSLQAVNMAAGLDQLLHGTNSMHGWGQVSTPDRTLLLARGFNATTRTYSYQVNEHFGSPAASAFRTPFQLVLRARVTLGTDPAANPFASTDGKAPTVEVWKGRLAPQVPNPVAILLQDADSLKVGLSPAQRAHLVAFNDTLAAKLDVTITEMATILSEAGPRPDPGAIVPKMQSKNESLKTLVEQAVAKIKAELTSSQWELLPERIRIPLAQPQAKPAKSAL
ncbi:MAG: hypothetical protein JWM95_4850 [Gemmatimonadetes bacterium]|nr:hypothetical protein [Gemmatimonadota bacterium]